MSVASKVAIPEAKPAFELIDGRLVQKVSPRYTHARLQLELLGVIGAWARERGRVGSEWRFALDDAPGRPWVVPDVAYLSYERVPRKQREAAEEPHVAPDLAVEILSPGDWRQHVDRKTELYLAGGTIAVIEVDPAQRTVTIYDGAGRQVYRDGGVAAHAAFSGLRVDVTELFDSVE